MSRSINLIGKRFGLLTVIDKTDKLEDRYYTWLCKCECGVQIVVNTKRLTRGTVTDCGCIPKSTARNGCIAENLSVRQFGEFTVLHQMPSKNGRTRWDCQCSCGTRKIISSSVLKSGRKKHCGCKGKKKFGRISDISEQRFGRLVADYPTEKRNTKGSVIWSCRCDCGKVVEASQDSLVFGNCRSCGCLKKEIQAEINNKLDFIDGTCVQLLEKRKYRSDNTSGFRGVHPIKDDKWRVTIGFKKQRFHVGYFNAYEEAVEARLEAEDLIHNGFVQAYRSWLVMAEKDRVWAEENPFVYDVHKIDNRFYVKTTIDDYLTLANKNI